MSVRDVQSRQRDLEVISEAFPPAHIQLRVPGQMARSNAAAVGESRADIHVGRSICLPWQVRIQTHIRCISLVMIESKEPGRRTEIRETAIDRAKSVGRLI